MARADDGGRAFPSEQGFRPDGGWNDTYTPGLTKREYFAAAALTGLMASTSRERLSIHDAEIAARTCFVYADAMIAVGKKA